MPDTLARKVNKAVDAISYKVFKKPRNVKDFIDKYNLKAGDEVEVTAGGAPAFGFYEVILETKNGNGMRLGTFSEPGRHLSFSPFYMTSDKDFNPLQEMLMRSIDPAEELDKQGIKVVFFRKNNNFMRLEEAKYRFIPSYKNRIKKTAYY